MNYYDRVGIISVMILIVILIGMFLCAIDGLKRFVNR